MHFIHLWLVFLLGLLTSLTDGFTDNQYNNVTSPWSCHLGSERRLECRNLYNFYFSSSSLCANDYSLLVRQKIDELHLINDYNCFDQSHQCYFEFDSSWSMCLNSLRKLIIKNLSFIVRNYDPHKVLSVEYLKIVNTHGSITELLRLFQFSNRTSIYIQNGYPRWSGMDLYAIYQQFSYIRLKQLWINVLDWYPVVFLRYDQQTAVRQWLTKIPCLHIEMGDCRDYYHDMVFLRDLFMSRDGNFSELYCHANQGALRYHWSKVPELSHGYKRPPRRPPSLLAASELREKCFDQFTKSRYSINSHTDLAEFYSNFRIYQTHSIPLWNTYPYVTMPNLPSTSTISSSALVRNRPGYQSEIGYLKLNDHAKALNETRWLAWVAAYPDGRYLVIDNRNQQILLLDENGTFVVDLTSMLLRQIQSYLHDQQSSPNIHNAYSFSKIHIDQDGFVYLVSTLAYYIYIFSPTNRLMRCLTPEFLGIPIIRSNCLAITHTGLIYICDDTHRVIRIYTRMGVPQRTMRLDYFPLKLFISNSRLFTYSLEHTAAIQMYTLAGTHIRALEMCSYNLPSEILWFRGKYFLTCATFIYVLDDQGEQIAEHSLHQLFDITNAVYLVQDFALNKNGILLVTFRRNETLFNRYWVLRPAKP